MPITTLPYPCSWLHMAVAYRNKTIFPDRVPETHIPEKLLKKLHVNLSLLCPCSPVPRPLLSLLIWSLALPTPLSLSLSLSHRLAPFFSPCFTLFIHLGCLAVSSASRSAFNPQQAHDFHPHWERCASPGLWQRTDTHPYPSGRCWQLKRRNQEREGGKGSFSALRYYHLTVSTGDQQMSACWDIRPRPEQSSWALAHTYTHWAARHALSCVCETRVLTNMLLYLVVTSAMAVSHGCLDDPAVQWLRLFKICIYITFV